MSRCESRALGVGLRESMVTVYGHGISPCVWSQDVALAMVTVYGHGMSPCLKSFVYNHLSIVICLSSFVHHHSMSPSRCESTSNPVEHVGSRGCLEPRTALVRCRIPSLLSCCRLSEILRRPTVSSDGRTTVSSVFPSITRTSIPNRRGRSHIVLFPRGRLGLESQGQGLRGGGRRDKERRRLICKMASTSNPHALCLVYPQ